MHNAEGVAKRRPLHQRNSLRVMRVDSRVDRTDVRGLSAYLRLTGNLNVSMRLERTDLRKERVPMATKFCRTLLFQG